MNDLKKTVSKKLKMYRANAGMSSQQALADASGVSAAAIATYEAGTAAPLLETTVKLAEALGCTPNDLCGWGES